MFRFTKKVFFVAMTFFSFNPLNTYSLKCVSLNNQEWKIRAEIIDINNNEPSFYSYSIKINKCKGSCNSINDPYAKICVPDVIKSINVKVFNLMPRTNERRHIESNKTCKFKSRLDASVCSNKPRWNEDKCRYECKQLIDNGICDKEFFWNPSNFECECDKSCDIREYLDYKNYKCRNKIVHKLVGECSENIDGNEMIYNETLIAISLNTKAFNSCTINIALFVIFLITSISISSFFIYFHWHFKKDSIPVRFNHSTKTTI